MKTNVCLRIATVAAILAGASMAYGAVLNSNTPTVSLSALAPESLTVSLSGSTQTWSTGTGNALTPGNASNPGNAAINVTTTWALATSRTAVALYAFFVSTNATTGTADATQHIPSSAFEIKVGAGAFTPVSATNAGFGVAGSSLQLFTQAISGANRNSNRTDALTFNINLSTLPQLPADTYTGTLDIQAQATP